MDEEGPFKETYTQVECPYCDKFLSITVGWVNRDYPMLNINAPTLINHINEDHANR